MCYDTPWMGDSRFHRQGIAIELLQFLVVFLLGVHLNLDRINLQPYAVIAKHFFGGLSPPATECLSSYLMSRLHWCRTYNTIANPIPYSIESHTLLQCLHKFLQPAEIILLEIKSTEF